LKVNRIDLASKSFVSNGTKYYIDVDSICYDRLVIFLSLIPELSYGLTVEEMQSNVVDILKFLRGQKSSENSDKINIHTIVFDTTQAVINLSSQLNQVQGEDFFKSTIEQHLNFCTLFVNTQNEDTTVYSAPVMERKKSDWKKDMNMYDFFLLAKMQLPNYKKVLQELLEG